MSGRLAALIAMAVVVVLAIGGGIAFAITTALSSSSHHAIAAPTTLAPSTTTTVTTPSTAPSATTAPSSTASTAPPSTASGLPSGPWSLPAGNTVQGIVDLGFPQTALGGVSMAYETLAATTTLDPGVLATAENTVEVDPPANLVSQAEQETSQLRGQFGLPVTGPTTATIAAQIQGCWVGSATSTEVTGGLEGELVESDVSHGQQYAPVQVPFVAQWTGTDWRINESAANSVHLPSTQIPPASGVSDDGWHACSGGR